MNDSITPAQRLAPLTPSMGVKVTAWLCAFAGTLAIVFACWQTYRHIESRIERRLQAENEVRLAAYERVSRCTGRPKYSRIEYIDGCRVLICFYND
jgi:hypothetical protein